MSCRHYQKHQFNISAPNDSNVLKDLTPFLLFTFNEVSPICETTKAREMWEQDEIHGMQGLGTLKIARVTVKTHLPSFVGSGWELLVKTPHLENRTIWCDDNGPLLWCNNAMKCKINRFRLHVH